MRLIIDQGNSRTKLSIFDKGQLTESRAADNTEAIEIVSTLTARHEFDAAIYSSVCKTYDEAFIKVLRKKTRHIVCMGETTHLPIKIGYRTPHTLGQDRIAAAVGAWTEHPGEAMLIIDAGTAVTYDLVSANGTFEGGNIAPGAELRLKSLHEHTGRLPLVAGDGELPLMGYDTETALRAGALRGIAYEIEGYIAACETEKGRLLVFLTGGDAERLAAITKRAIFVDKNLVPKGLNRILEYNVEI